MKLKITKKLHNDIPGQVNDIFGQFQATYLDEKQHYIDILVEGQENQRVYLNELDKVTVDLLYISKIKEVSVGMVLQTNEFILSSYAKNPYLGVVVIVTGKFIIL